MVFKEKSNIPNYFIKAEIIFFSSSTQSRKFHYGEVSHIKLEGEISKRPPIMTKDKREMWLRLTDGGSQEMRIKVDLTTVKEPTFSRLSQIYQESDRKVRIGCQYKPLEDGSDWTIQAMFVDFDD